MAKLEGGRLVRVCDFAIGRTTLGWLERGNKMCALVAGGDRQWGEAACWSTQKAGRNPMLAYLTLVGVLPYEDKSGSIGLVCCL